MQRNALRLRPFPRLLAENPTLALAVHARLVRDTLAQVEEPVRLRGVRPFVTPDTCQILKRSKISTGTPRP